MGRFDIGGLTQDEELLVRHSLDELAAFIVRRDTWLEPSSEEVPDTERPTVPVFVGAPWV
jgi:hypothetical protein